jgi:hypothetical protein
MRAQFINEQNIGDILRPRGSSEVINAIKDLPLNQKIEKLQKMQDKWGDMYKDLLSRPEILENLREDVKNELNKLNILEKEDFIGKLERKLPDIFSNMRNKELLEELKNYILDQDFKQKSQLIFKFFKSWPDLFKDVEDDPRVDEETNQILLLYKIKGAINEGNVDQLQGLIHKMGERYGRDTILDKASEIIVDEGGYHGEALFNRKDIEQLKISLYKETRSEEERLRDEYYNVYAFIGYADYIEKNVEGEILHKKRMGIENLVKINKYDTSSLSQINMMKMRANAQYGYEEGSGVFGVYISKEMWDEDYAYNHEITDTLRKFIEENKFTL